MPARTTQSRGRILQAVQEGRTKLDFSFRQLLHLPKTFFEVAGLKKIDLFETCIDVLEWLSKILFLEVLYLSEAKSAEAFLPTIHELCHLRVLKMGYARMPDTLPGEFWSSGKS